MNTSRSKSAALAGALAAWLIGCPIRAQEPAPKAAACPALPGQPGWLEQQMQRREASLSADRGRAIELLKEFLTKHADAPQRADALFRLAELQWERAEEQLLARMRRYERELDDFRSGRASKRPPEPRIDLADSIRVYEEILEKHPDFQRSDTVLYLYGFALNEQGDEETALAIFRSLLKRFPRSSFVPDAYLAIGEHHFAQGRFGQARRAYAKVLEHIDSPLYDLALYKTAWCHFKQGQADQAAEYFKRVLGRARMNKEAKKPNRLSTPSADLEREALEDLAFTFSEYGGAKEAYRFMKQVGGQEYSIKVLRRLGDVFFRQARYAEAIDSYRMLVDEFPLAIDSPEHQARIAEAYQRMGKMERSLAERRRLAERYGPGSSWLEQHEADAAARAKAIALAEDALRFAAMYRHKTAQEKQNTKAYQQAERAYATYLKIFPDTDRAPEIHFYLGEVLFKLERFDQAAKHYQRAAKQLTDPKRRRDAGYATVLAWDRQRRDPAEVDKPPAARQDLSEAEKGFVAAVAAYRKIAPDDAKLAQLAFEVGRVYYLRARYEEAATTLLELVERSPTDAFAGPAADLALDCYTRSGQWTELERWARRFIEEGWFEKTALGGQLHGFVTSAVFQNAAAHAKKGKHLKAAREYQRLVEEFPSDDLAPKALFNAAVALERAGEKAEAVEQYRKITERYPDRAADALFVIAGIYERQYDYDAAAQAYQTFAGRFTEDDRAAAALWQAALLHRARQAAKQEAAALAEFTRSFPDHPRAAEAEFHEAEALARAGDQRAAERVLRAYLKHNASRQGRVREATLQLGLAMLAQDKVRLARRQLERCAAFRPTRKPRGQELAAAAECRFRLGELIFAEYEKIRLRPPMKRLAKLLRQKAAKLKQAEALFTRVVEAGNMEWASAALFRIGDMYAKFARAIYDAPLPKGLSERELEVYKQELQGLAFPIEDKALSAFTISYQMAQKHAYYSVWTERTMQMLRKLDPARFPPEAEVRPDTRWADSFTDFGLELKRLPLPKKPAHRKGAAKKRRTAGKAKAKKKGGRR